LYIGYRFKMSSNYLIQKNVMPLFTDKYKYGRRKFIKNVAGTAGFMTTVGMFVPFSVEAKNKKLNLALLSDTHVPEDVNNNYRGFFPYSNFKTAAIQVASSGLSGAIITGDLARLTGESGDYKNLNKLLQPIRKEMPVAMTLGNHDNLKNFIDSYIVEKDKEVFVKNKHVMVLDHADVQLVLLDSLMLTNLVSGLIGKDQRDWLSNYLELNTRKPIMIFIHHTLGDRDSDLLDTDKLFKIIKPYQQVKAIFHGHSHEYSYKIRDDIHLINLPSTAYNFDDDQPLGWVEASLGKKSGAFTLHAFDGNITGDGEKKVLKWR